MEKSATDIMQDALVAAVLDAIVAWKAASGGLANVLARDLGAVHPNTTLAQRGAGGAQCEHARDVQPAAEGRL
jgi:hypothetical protein